MHPFSYESTLPSDAFYSNLDGEMDANGNGVYGEVSDSIDVYAEVNVGRFTGNGIIEIESIINKTINYFSTENVNIHNPEFRNNFFFWGWEVFNPSIGIEICESIISIIPENVKIDSLYENISPNFNLETSLEKFNMGYNVLYGQSHGSKNKMGSPTGWGLYSNRIVNLEEFSGLYFFASCYPGNFKYNSLAQKAINTETGGCMNYIGSSVSEFPTQSAYMNKLFFINFFEDDLNDIGTNLTNAKVTGFTNLTGPSYNRFLYFAYNLFGDPTNLFFTDNTNNINIEDISDINIGTATVTGFFDNYYGKPIIVSLLSDSGDLIAKTVTNSNSFTLDYSNLYSDSVTISFYGKNILLKEEKYETTSNNDLELEFSNFRLIDDNQSSVIENKEQFCIALDIETIKNQSTFDSLKITLENYNSEYFNITPLTEISKIKIPDETNTESFELNNIIFENTLLNKDTVLTISLKIETFNSQISGNLNKRYKSYEVFYKEIIIPVSKPRLNLNYVNYIEEESQVSIALTNSYTGKIDSAKIRIIGDKTSKLGDAKDEIITLKNINGNFSFSDSLIFTVNEMSNPYQIGILINDDLLEDEYLSEIFTKDNNSHADFNLNYSFNENNMIGLDFTYSNSSYDNFNIYLFEGDTVNTTPILLNLKTINKNNFEFYNDSEEKKYIKVSTISDSYDESHFSRFFQLNSMKSYMGSPYSISQYEIFSPVFITEEEKIAISSTTSSVEGFKFDGSLINNNTTLYDAITSLGISPSESEGFAIGDVNKDGFNDFISYNYSTTLEDSITINLIDIEHNVLLAKKKLYGFLYFNAPVLVDYDDDGELEILVPLFNGNLTGSEPKGAYIYLLKYNEETNKLDHIEPFPIISSSGSFHVHSPTLYDLNNNGVKELIFNSGKRLEIYRTDTYEKIVSKSHSTNLTGPVSICDVNDNGIPEIYFMTELSATQAGILYSYELDTSDTLYTYDNWQDGKVIEMNSLNHLSHDPPSPFFADIENDGVLEILVATGEEIIAFNSEGNVHNPSVFPIQLDSEISGNNISTPSMADFDGDDYLDFLFIDSNSKIWCYSGFDGSVLEGFPLTIPNVFKKHLGGIPIADLDNDNDLEFAVGNNNGRLFIYDYEKQTSNRKIFDQFRADKYNSGVFLRENLLVGIENDEPQNLILDKKITLLNQYPNPFNPTMKINFQIENSGITLFKLFNIKGELVQQINYNYESKGLKSIIFNANNLVSGTYVYTLEFEGKTISNKCLLLK